MERPRRKRNRLQHWDYSTPGFYFITACSTEKRHIFGQIVGGDVLIAPQVVLSGAGRAVEKVISSMPGVVQYVIMPNHIHLLIRVPAAERGPMRTSAPTAKEMCSSSVPGLMRYLKREVTHMLGQSVWQRGYHDHIVRSEDDYLRICHYIDTNPLRWAEDCYFSDLQEDE